MNCEQVEKLLLNATEKLSGAEQQSIKSHLVDCPECKAFFAAHERLVNSIRPSSFPSALEADLKKRVLSRIKSDAPAPEQSGLLARVASLFRQPPFVVACIMILLVFVWVTMSLKPEPKSQFTGTIYAKLPVALGKFEISADHQDFLAKEGRHEMKAGEILRASAQDSCTFSFPAGQKIEALGSYTVSMANDRLFFKSGEGRLNLDTAGKSFHIILPDFAINIRSTIIELSVSDQLNRVKVVKGIVEIVIAGKTSQLLKAGESFATRSSSVYELPAVASSSARIKPFEDTGNSAGQPQITSTTALLASPAEPDGQTNASSSEPVASESTGNLDNAF